VIRRGVLPAFLATFRSAVWPYATAALFLGGVGATGWWSWRTDRIAHARDRRRQDEGVKAGRLTVAEVDVMTGTEFEEPVASLCRRDGCTEVRRVGGSHDKGADVLGRHPDSRAMVIQCQRYAPSSTITRLPLGDQLVDAPGHQVQTEEQ
jgi:restriction system protein